MNMALKTKNDEGDELLQMRTQSLNLTSLDN